MYFKFQVPSSIFSKGTDRLRRPLCVASRKHDYLGIILSEMYVIRKWLFELFELSTQAQSGCSRKPRIFPFVETSSIYIV